MNDLLPVNTIDLIVVLAIVATAVLGFRSGAIPQVLGLAGAGAAVALIVAFAPQITNALAGVEQPARALVAIGGALLAVALGQAIGAGLGTVVRGMVGGGLAGGIDSSLGALLGASQALVMAWLIGGLLATSSIPVLAATAQRSGAVRWLLDVLPPPADVVGEVGAIIDESGLPQVFSGLEPLPAPPVDLPADARTAEIAARAVASTVRVEAQACGASFTGAAFSVAEGYFVTNAHVVAGADRIVLRGATGTTRGTLVLFDPDLDVALVRAPGLRLPALVLASHAPGRGAVGAAIGYPNGAGLTTLPAAVTAEVRARGRDLYGRAPVVRDILELRAAVEPGMSGGPLVLADGTVGGVVFAESRTDPMVGYALDPTAVAVEVAAGVGHGAAVDPGPCIR
ncbi:MAG: MarP family serine protease [Chloroflexi bacterium]|nr:MarP family serine protease [Chloroflexota bacterium]